MSTTAESLNALADRVWYPIVTAPKDGTAIQARIPGHGDDNVIAWLGGLVADNEVDECWAWHFVEDQEPPECWTDGICWASNAEGIASVQPTHWRELPPTDGADSATGKGQDPQSSREQKGSE